MTWSSAIRSSGTAYITLPDKPGLGLTLNEDVARAHVRPDSTFFE